MSDLTLTELTMAEAIARAAESERDGLGGSSREGSQDRWGDASHAETLRLARDGYPAGTAMLRQRLETLAPNLRESTRPQAVWGPSGSSVDIARFLAGEPDNMIDTVRRRRPSMVLRIAVERAVSSGVKTANIHAVGASVLAVVERLRTAGVASEVWATFTVNGRDTRGGGTYQLRVKVQDAGRPIDLDTLAFWVIHPATFRRLAFAVEEREPLDVRKRFGFYAHGGGYGYPTTLAEGFDEYAPAREHEVEPWITDVLARRTR